VIKKFWKQLQC